MERKYELTNETKGVLGRTLHRIVAVRSFGNVKEGDKGGWIEKESNLSHECNCWVYDDARVLDNAEVFGNAKVYDTAEVFGRGKVHGNAEVFHYAEVYGNAEVFHDAEVYGNATVRDRAMVYDNAKVCSSADVYGTAQVYGNAEVHGEAEMFGEAEVFGSAEVCGNARVSGKAVLRGDAVVSSNRDYIVFKNWWSSGRYFTWTRSNNLWAVGCFYGTGEELIRKAYKDSELSGREYERIVRYVNSVRSEEIGVRSKTNKNQTDKAMKDQRLKTLKELEREIRKLRNEVEEIHAQVRDLTFDELGLDFSEKLGDRS